MPNVAKLKFVVVVVGSWFVVVEPFSAMVN